MLVESHNNVFMRVFGNNEKYANAFTKIGVIFPLVICMIVWMIPNAIVAALLFSLLHIHFCIALTFDGFVRFSRYALSHKHPILDRIVSLSAIIFALVGIVAVPLVLYAYSLFISPDDAMAEGDIEWYHRPFATPVLQAIIILFGLLGVVI
ncbi:MAG: hypothetical protein COA45_02875 [Zetaproteobacteria bacterium]|nr:MAG: hypothetical protein COA45_02875 [Zetaproteobacteria bacterium]